MEKGGSDAENANATMRSVESQDFEAYQPEQNEIVKGNQPSRNRSGDTNFLSYDKSVYVKPLAARGLESV